MRFLNHREVCFDQESLPITYHNFRHKSLVRPKNKSPNWEGSTHKLHGQFFKESSKYAPNKYQIPHNLPK